MSSPIAITPSTATTLAAKPQTEREQLHEAAQQFEAIFVRQMLAEARKTNLDDGGLFDSEALGTFRQMQDERYAEIASRSGSLGLASMIEAQIARHLPQEPQ